MNIVRPAAVEASVGARETLSGISTPPAAASRDGSPPKKAKGSVRRFSRSSPIRGTWTFS